MHTPEEARELWCPFARTTTIYGDPPFDVGWGMNRAGMNALGSSNRCLADGCSAWRWAETFSVTDRHDAEIAEKFMGKGFCGLAGRP